MSTYHFDIDSDGEATTEIVEAADHNAAIRQALLLISEILRDHGLSSGEPVTVRLAVRDQEGYPVWSGSANGGHPDRVADPPENRSGSPDPEGHV